MNKVILTGFCRSGTTSTAMLFEKLGVPSHHQKMGPGKNYMRSHDLLQPPQWAADYYQRKGRAIREGGGFESSWEFAHFMYGLHRQAPETRWLVMLRDPADAVNSLKHHNRKNAALEVLAGLYNETLLDIYKQCRLMVPRPRYMLFERYIAGDYNVPLLGLFDLELSVENLGTISKHLTLKVRTSGDYEARDCGLFRVGREILRLIRRTCEELT